MLKLLLVVFFVLIGSPCAFCYHIEWTTPSSSDIYSTDQFIYGQYAEIQASAWYKLIDANVDSNTGVIYPIWDIGSNVGGYPCWDDESNQIEIEYEADFRIVSDYGNVTPETVTLWFQEGGDGGTPCAIIYGEDYYTWTGYAGSSLKIADYEYSFTAGCRPIYTDFLELETNTTYHIESTLSAKLEVTDISLPDSFESQQALDEWLQNNPTEGGLNAWAGDGLFYGLMCISNEENLATPEPATMLLFATGIAGLAAVGRRRK